MSDSNGLKFVTYMFIGAGVTVAGLAVWMAVRKGNEPKPEPTPLLQPPTGEQSTTVGWENGKQVQLTLVDIGNGKKLRAEAAVRYRAMYEAAKRDGVILSPNSAFRTMEEQTRLYNLYLSGKGNLAAKPGYSNHQGGRSLDLNTGTGVTGYLSKVYRWLFSNAADYGFKNDVKGEPWHWTYYGPMNSSVAGLNSLGFSPLGMLPS